LKQRVIVVFNLGMPEANGYCLPRILKRPIIAVFRIRWRLRSTALDVIPIAQVLTQPSEDAVNAFLSLRPKRIVDALSGFGHEAPNSISSALYSNYNVCSNNHFR
jgi:hypothetical protein